MEKEQTIAEKFDDQFAKLEESTARKAGISVADLRKEKEEFDKLVANGEDKTEKHAVKFKKNNDQAKKAVKEIKAKAAKKDKKPIKAKRVAAGAGIKALTLAKIRYKQKGDVTNCGDWLAVTLKDAFVTKEKGKSVFDLKGFTDTCKDNGLDTKEAWATNRSPGWQGRFRMNGRQKLEIVLAREGHILIGGKKVKPTGVFLKAMEKKHPIIEDPDNGED